MKNQHTLKAAPFAFVEAKYRKEEVPEYQGNPFIEALPELPSDVELAKALVRRPAFDPKERELKGETRIQMLSRLKTLVVPFPRLVHLARGVLKLIRAGYGPRGPFTESQRQLQQAMYDLQQSGVSTALESGAGDAQLSMSLIGASGCGKTSGLKRIMGLLPRVIYHRDPGVWQLPTLYVEMSYDGESLHTLASQLFAELDRLLPDAGYAETFTQRTRLNAHHRLFKALKIAELHGVGMILVDETQNQKGRTGAAPKAKKGSADIDPSKDTPLSKLLISASNMSHVPMLFAGTLQMQQLMIHNVPKARRHDGNGSQLWLPLERGTEDRPGEFDHLLNALWHYQWIRKPGPLTPELRDVFWRLTQGIPDIVVKLYESSQEAAISNKTEELTPALIRATHKREFNMTRFAIEALRNKDEELLATLPDLFLPDPVQAVRTAPEQFQPPERQRRAKKPALGAALRPRPFADGQPDAPGPAVADVADGVAEGADIRPAAANDPDVTDLKGGMPS